MKRVILFPLLILILNTSLFTQTILDNPEDIKELGKANSIEYKRSLISLSEAEDDVISLFKIDDTSLSLSSANTDLSDGDWELESSVNIPIIDKLSLSGSIDQDLKGTAGVKIEPFKHSASKALLDINLRSQMVLTNTAELNSEINAVSVVLDWMSAKRSLDLQIERVDMNDILYSDNKSRYESGNITLDELRESLITWSESRKQLLIKKQSFTLAEKNLYSILAVNRDEVDIRKFNVPELELYLNALKNDIDVSKADFLKSSSYIQSAYSVQTAKVEFENTWIYEPDISANANVSFDTDAEYDFSASINFTVSLDDFQSKERDKKLQEFNISLSEHQIGLNDVKLEFSQKLDLLESSEIDTSIIKIEYEEAQVLYSEAKLLFDTGEYSEIDLEESRIYVSQAENDLFDSLVGEYIYWMEFRKYL